MMELKQEFKIRNIFETIDEKIKEKTKRSYWSEGVTKYALELSRELKENIIDGYFKAKNLTNSRKTEKQLLNGAKNWSQFSRDGNSLVYDYDIAGRLCNETQWERTRHGKRRPNRKEDWLDIQAKALQEAATRIQESIKETLATTEKI